MNLARCPMGHFYDKDRFDNCPHCQNGVVIPNSPPMPASPFNNMPDTPRNNNIIPSVFKQKDDSPYVFISYAHSDSKEVVSIIDFLKANHFNVWYDEGIKSGYEWADEISRKIKHCKQFICFISQNSINSESVKDEIHIAWKYNINTIVVYLEKVVLDGGLEMKLDRKQAILKYALNEQDFYKKMSLSISQDVVNLKNDENPNDIRVNDKYEIIRMLSQGGTAKTYLAKNKATGVQVLLKHGTYDNTVSGQRIKRSFEREKAALAKNISPFLPSLYDYFYDDRNIYIAESYIEGTAINQITGLSLCEKIELFIKVSKVIKELHDKRIYHCDIKPEHIIVNHHGCFLIDLGSAEDARFSTPDDFKMGTVTYAAPEQFISYNGENDIFGNYQNTDNSLNTDRSIDERTDIYALGRVMVKVISNEENVTAMTEDINITTVLFADVTKTIGEFSNNPLLQAIIEKMVREKKSNRYNNMDEVIHVLEDFLKIYKTNTNENTVITNFGTSDRNWW